MSKQNWPDAETMIRMSFISLKFYNGNISLKPAFFDMYKDYLMVSKGKRSMQWLIEGRIRRLLFKYNRPWSCAVIFDNQSGKPPNQTVLRMWLNTPQGVKEIDPDPQERNFQKILQNIYEHAD